MSECTAYEYNNALWRRLWGWSECTPINSIHCANRACLFNFSSQVGRRNESLYTYQLVSLLSSSTSFHAANNVLLCLSKFIAIFHYMSQTANGSNNKNTRKYRIKHRQTTDSMTTFLPQIFNKNVEWQFILVLPFYKCFCSLSVFNNTSRVSYTKYHR